MFVQVLELLRKADIRPIALGCAMLQGRRWQEKLVEWQNSVLAPLASPIFGRGEDDRWHPLQYQAQCNSKRAAEKSCQ